MVVFVPAQVDSQTKQQTKSTAIARTSFTASRSICSNCSFLFVALSPAAYLPELPDNGQLERSTSMPLKVGFVESGVWLKS